MKRGAWIALVLLAAGLAAWWFAQRPGTLAIAIEPGPNQPTVSLSEAGIDPAAVDLAVDFARRRNTQALVIARGGHVVFEHYAADVTRDTAVRFDELAPVVATLLLGTALNDRIVLDLDLPLTRYLGEGADASRTLRSLISDGNGGADAAQDAELLAQVLEAAAKRPYQEQVVDKLWKPLGNGGLQFELQGSGPREGAVFASCCLTARIGDWLRVGQMLARDGVFEANHYTPPGFVSGVLTAATAQSGQRGFVRVDGQFATRGVAWVAGRGHQRLWVVPSLDLVILRVGEDPPASEAWDEAMIPDSIIRGTRGWQPNNSGAAADPNRFAPH